MQQSNIESLFQGNLKSNNFIFDLETNFKNFFTNWIIVDSIDSLNGPSNWSLKKITNKNNKNINNKSKQILNKIILLQASQIISNENSKPSTSILYKNKFIQENLYFKIAFISKAAGEIFINFKYVDYENYFQLRISRESKTKGKISLIINRSGSSKIFADLDCEKMVSFLKKCSGFEIEEKNKIEFFSFKDKFIVLFNDMIIFTASLQEILKDINGFDSNNNNSKRLAGAFNSEKTFVYGLNNDNNFSENNLNWNSSRIRIGINNQKNFEIHDLQIKNLDLDDVKKFQSDISDVRNYARGKNYEFSNARRDKNKNEK